MSYRNAYICKGGGRVFPFEKWAQIKTFWQLLWNSSQSFPYPDEDKNCSLLFHKLALLFCEEYRCTSFPHFLLPVPCFTQTVVSSRFFLTFYTRGNLLIKILEFMKLIHCFGLKKTKSNEVVGLSIICFTSLGYRKKKIWKLGEVLNCKYYICIAERIP